MYRKSFPDLVWLKRQIEFKFTDNQLKGWPNVIIHTESNRQYRPDIKGTLSLFTNLKGASYCQTGKHKVRIEPDTFFISNLDQEYTLLIEEKQPTETFNIHFSRTLVDDVFMNLTRKDGYLSDNPQGEGKYTLNFHNTVYRKDEQLEFMLNTLSKNAAYLSDSEHEEQLFLIMEHLFLSQEHIAKEQQRLCATRISTQTETFKRLRIAHDYIHSFYFNPISLDELASEACLSKFHFLRLFKSVFRCSPHQYITRLRMEKAAYLLRQKQLSTNEISAIVGFENVSSFCRAFFRTYKQWPQSYVHQNSNFGKLPQEIAQLALQP